MRQKLWAFLLIAGLGFAWPGGVSAQQAASDDQLRRDGALGFLEHFAVRRVIEAVEVDASELTSFAREPDVEPEVWTLTGSAAITDLTGNREQYPYRAQLTVLCDAYERTACWDVQSLSLGQWVLSETSPNIVALAELSGTPAAAAEPAPTAEEVVTVTDVAATGEDGGEDIALLRRQAEAGDAAAQYGLAEVYRRGFPLARDDAKALELYGLSAGQGHAAAQFRLGELYDEGALVERDLERALAYYRQAAERGHAGAQYALAHIYHLGSGVAQDMAAAMAWYRQAAEQGDEWSQLALGDQYRIGLAVERDLAQSTGWYRRAAEQGNIFAQFELGNAYRFGNGVEPDAGQAMAWYRRSAEAGNPSAKLALEELETGGTEVAAAVESEPASLAQPEAAPATTTEATGSEPGAADPELGTELAYAAEPSYSNEETIAQLLGLAADQAARLALTTPEGDNAHETYRLVLSLQPDNAAALAGIEQIGVRYVELAERARSRGSLTRARVYADKALDLAPNHPEVLAMDSALRAQEQPAPVATAEATAEVSEVTVAAEGAATVATVGTAATLATSSGSASGAQSPGENIEISALPDLSAEAGGTESLAVNRAAAPKPELLTSGLLYAVSGLDAHQIGNYDEAIEYYSLAIQARDLPDRSLAYVYNNRGASYRNLSRYNKAIEDYDAAIRLNPDYATAFYNRGIAYDRKGFYGLAIDDFDTAIRLDPDLSDAYIQRGLAYVRDGRYDIAIENFSRAIDLNPELDSAYFNRGLAYHSKGDSDLAAEDIKKSYALNPDNPEYGEKMRELGIL